MSENHIYDLVIIGSGPGGLSAGIYAQRASLKTVLVEKGGPGGQIMLTDEVENYPGFEHITGAELAMKMNQHAESLGLETISDEVIAIEPRDKTHVVRLAGGQVLTTLTVIIATGGYPRKLGIPGENDLYGKGVSYCATCDGFFFRDRTVIVAGGGDTAVEEALYLAKITKKVYLAHRRDALRASPILQKRTFENDKIEVLWNTVLTGIQAGDSGVNNVLLKDTKTGDTRDLAVDGVFIFIGYLPNSKIVPEVIKRNDGGYILTDYKCETNIPGIYAIGDLKEKFARQIVTAAGDGCTAALAASQFAELKKATGV